MTTILLALLLLANGSADPGRLIAHTDIGDVRYSMIACQQQDAADCHAREQQRLAHYLEKRWIVTATRLYDVKLSAEEEAAVAKEAAAQESHARQAAAHFHALDVAALRIRRGEDREQVLAELHKQGITAKDLDDNLQHLPTLAAADRAAAGDELAQERQAIRDFYTRPYILAHLRDLVRRRATLAHVPFDVAEERFWSEVAARIHTRIVDPTYTMPDRKGILVKQ